MTPNEVLNKIYLFESYESVENLIDKHIKIWLAEDNKSNINTFYYACDVKQLREHAARHMANAGHAKADQIMFYKVFIDSCIVKFGKGFKQYHQPPVPKAPTVVW